MSSCHHAGITPPIPVVQVNVVSELFNNNSIVITLEWTVENGTFNNLSVVPEALESINIGASIRLLMISYNIIYNVTAVASLCGQYSTHSVQLYYGELLQYAIVLLWHLFSIILINSSVHFPASLTV